MPFSQVVSYKVKTKMLLRVLIFSLAFCFSLRSLAETCEDIEEKSKPDQILIPSYESGLKVVGNGRAYIYSAPNETCFNKQLFLIPNDLLNGYVEYKGFIYVLYFNPATGKETTGWIKKDRLTKTETGVGPKPN